MIIACCGMIIASAQTLFTYGRYSADVKDFLRAYNKNNNATVSNKAKAINDYLGLYINSRLKIREAYERGYDTLPQIKNEVANLRTQILESYMNDPSSGNRLEEEAFRRSLKDIHVAHIFISFRNSSGVVDTVAARNKLDSVLRRLKKGEDFMTVAMQSSDDPSAKTNKGDIGYITVFTLPYEFENVIYNTPVGKYSAPYRSKAGYHIFKKLAERRAAGKIQAQQILLAIPPGSDETTKKQIAERADSLYRRIMAGDDFGKLAAQFSNDYISANNSGTMSDISVGQYDPAFEKVLWSLPKNGAVSKPFETRHGYHIVKRVAVKPVITDPDNKTNKQDLKQKVMGDSRWKSSRNFIYERVSKSPGVKKHPYSEPVLWALSDSLLDYKPAGIGNAMNRQSVLFTIGDSTFRVNEWIIFSQAYRYKSDGTGIKPYDQVMDEFVQAAMMSYYRDHLENYNAEFRNQMEEFKDGNLFFEIMQREIWNRAQTDSSQLVTLYEKNKTKYTWQPSADAVVFFCADKATAQSIYDELQKNPAVWRTITATYTEKVVADSARYEWDQLPNLGKAVPKAGMITAPLVNVNDNSASFAYIIRVYPQVMQRSYNDAKGLVINDYQNVLEEQWIADLKKKYPVVINQKVLAGISK